MVTYENGDLNSITQHRLQSKSERLDMPKPKSQSFLSFSNALVWIGENNVKENVLLRFHR